MTREVPRTRKANLVMPLIPVLLLLASLLLTGPAPGVRRVSASNHLSPANIFQVFELDGDLIDNPPGLPFDWNTVNAIPVSSNVAPMIAHTGLIRDPAPSSIFTTAGSRDNNDITEWRHSTGTVQDKGDISNAYAAAFLQNNELIFVVGADRVEGGDGTLGFWLLQKRVVAAADGTFRTGPLNTDPLARHTIGDLLVIVEFSRSFGTLKIFEWVGSSGSEIGGTLNEVTGTYPIGSVFALSNDAPQKAPWLYVPKKGPAGTIPASAFFEGAVNVGVVLPGAAFLCTPTFLVATRGSTSVSGQLQDFVLSSFRPVVSIQDAVTCEATPTTLPSSLSEGTPPYSLNATATGGLDVFVRGITIGATTPGGPPGEYQIATTATDANGCIGSATGTLKILAKPCL